MIGAEAVQGACLLSFFSSLRAAGTAASMEISPSPRPILLVLPIDWLTQWLNGGADKSITAQTAVKPLATYSITVVVLRDVLLPHSYPWAVKKATQKPKSHPRPWATIL